MKGLRWEAVHRSGGKKEVDGRFTVEAVNLAGAPLPIPSGGELDSVIGPINEALAPLGIGLRLPKVDTSGGVARITPLAIQIFESPLRASVLGPLFGNIQPLRQPLIDELFGLAEEFDNQTGLGGEEEVQEGDREVTQVECNGDLPPNASLTCSHRAPRRVSAAIVPRARPRPHARRVTVRPRRAACPSGWRSRPRRWEGSARPPGSRDGPT